MQVAYADKENSEEVVKVLSYLEVVEKVKHSCDETEVINLIEEHKLEREQLLTDHLKSKQVSVFFFSFLFLIIVAMRFRFWHFAMNVFSLICFHCTSLVTFDKSQTTKWK